VSVSSPVGTRGSFPEEKAAAGMKLTAHLRLEPKSRIVGLYLHSLMLLHSVVLK
jgi:hypothetical protein